MWINILIMKKNIKNIIIHTIQENKIHIKNNEK